MPSPMLAARQVAARQIAGRTAEKPVAFIDSGIGGLPYCSSFRALRPAVPVAYVADRAHFPYGPRSRQDLVAILVDLVARLVSRMDPRLVVIACNTASVSALDDLRAAFPDLPFVGTVPAVKPAALASAKRRIGVLATERTVGDPYALHLARRFAPDCELAGIAAPELVDFVERRYALSGREERLAVASSYVRRFRALGVDSVVLGCTHFLFLADEFIEAGGDDIAIFDSREGVARRAASLLVSPSGGERSGSDRPEDASVAPGSVFVTGDPPQDPTWGVLARHFALDFAGSFGGEA